MSLQRKKKSGTKRRLLRTRRRLGNNVLLPRASVFRSSKQIYVQIIDDNQHKTVVSCSSLVLNDLKGDKKAVARSVGLELAKRAKEAGVDAVRFDRGSYLYHGRVQALCEGLREGGLKV